MRFLFRLQNYQRPQSYPAQIKFKTIQCGHLSTFNTLKDMFLTK